MQQNRHLLLEAELIFQRHFLGLVRLQQSNKTLTEVYIVHGDTKIIRFIPAQLTPFTGSKLHHDTRIITTRVLACGSMKKRCSHCVEKKNHLDVTECFIALMICSTCFGHFYAHHQELETICVLLPPMVCSFW